MPLDGRSTAVRFKFSATSKTLFGSGGVQDLLGPPFNLVFNNCLKVNVLRAGSSWTHPDRLLELGVVHGHAEGVSANETSRA